MVSLASLPSPSSVFSAYASISTSVMLFRTMFDQIIPHQVQNYVFSAIRCYFQPRSSSMITLYIDERDGLTSNELYDAAETYLCTKISPSVEFLKLFKRPKDSNISINFARSEKIVDFYQGIELQWRFISEDLSHNAKVSTDDHGDQKRYFELSFQNKYKDIVLSSYVSFVLQKAKEIKDEKKVVKLHTLSNMHSYSSAAIWDSINLDHPSTFDTLAMEPSLKKAIMEDLDRFVRRKNFYRKVGKAWKRGYLLYGPPGTGKSSLIAAMANYLKFDIYDLDLANVRHDSDLKKLFLRTCNRSIIVIEDIDCSVKLPERHADGFPLDQEFTLSGLLNFIDGLWSSCGDERIIIFTTNNKDKLDPALLRPGRMDMHIHMSYLTTDGFKLLASNYLDIDDDRHWRFREIEKLIKGVEVTPAEVAEELMKCDDVDVSLEGVVNFLKRKKRENDDMKINDNNGSNGNNLQKPKRLKSEIKKINLLPNDSVFNGEVMEENGNVH